MTTTQPIHKARLSPLTKLAASLSLGSLIWTTWSLFDLLGAGPAGITVAACADAVWGAVIYAEYRGVRLLGKRWPVVAFGWASLIAVAVFLVWHGIDDNNLAMAAAGPFLPLGAKVIWALALADMRDPAALTDDELQTLARMERGMAFEEAQHRIEMRRRGMNAELQMAEVSTDFDIELMRQDKERALMRRRPLNVAQHDAPRITGSIIEAQHSRSITDAPDAQPVSAATHPAIAAGSPRTEASGETADGRHDAPLMRTASAPDAAPHVGDAAPQMEGLSKAAAVRAIRDAHPTASAPQIVERLAHHGIDADAAYVRTVLSRSKQRGNGNGGYM